MRRPRLSRTLSEAIKKLRFIYSHGSKDDIKTTGATIDMIYELVTANSPLAAPYRKKERIRQ